MSRWKLAREKDSDVDARMARTPESACDRQPVDFEDKIARGLRAVYEALDGPRSRKSGTNISSRCPRPDT